MAAAAGDRIKKHYWWLSNKKIVLKYVKEAKVLIATQELTDIEEALCLLEVALSVSARMEIALELKARCLLYLRRYKEVANMLQDYIPSLQGGANFSENSSSASSSYSFSSYGSSYSSSSSSIYDNSSLSSSSRAMFLSTSSSSGGGGDQSVVSLNEPACKCFSVPDLGKIVMSGILGRNVDKHGRQYWRYSVLGQACCHLGLMEDAMVLLQTCKRIATAAFRRQSTSLSDDIVSFNNNNNTRHHPRPTTPKTESEIISQLLNHIKLLLRRKSAAIAALDAGLYSEAIRHFSKILDGRRGGTPQGFLSDCYVHRASAYRSAGRIVEAIADCNRALALEPSCIEALAIRATLFEMIRCLPDSLHDLEHLKLLYNSILRDRKLPGPVWIKRQSGVQYREIPGKLCSLASKIQQLKLRVAGGETGNVVDYYALIGLRRGCCSRAELERAHLLLTLKHKPDKSWSFLERCEFADEEELEAVMERARVSSMLLYRLILKGYHCVMAMINVDENEQRKKAAAVQAQGVVHHRVELVAAPVISAKRQATTTTTTTSPSVFQGVFCRDLAAVGNLLSQANFSTSNRSIVPVKYEALSSC